MEARLWPTALGYTVGWLMASVYTEHAMLFSAVTNAVLTVNVLVIWRPGPDYVPLE